MVRCHVSAFVLVSLRCQLQASLNSNCVRIFRRTVHADHYAFPFIKYAADGSCTHISGADVPPLAFPPPVPPRAPDGAAAARHYAEHAADDGAGLSSVGSVSGEVYAEQPEDDAPNPGGAEQADDVPDLPPSVTWRNHVYWSCIEPPPDGDPEDDEDGGGGGAGYGGGGRRRRRDRWVRAEPLLHTRYAARCMQHCRMYHPAALLLTSAFAVRASAPPPATRAGVRGPRLCGRGGQRAAAAAPAGHAHRAHARHHRLSDAAVSESDAPAAYVRGPQRMRCADKTALSSFLERHHLPRGGRQRGVMHLS
jgi:hypothetical protein